LNSLFWTEKKIKTWETFGFFAGDVTC